MPELTALREATAALLDARGARSEAAIVRTGTLSLLPGMRRWSVGSREVDAMSFELALDAPELVRLRDQVGGPEPVRDALSDAVASDSTMLADLHVVLRLPGLGLPWGSVYRSAPQRPQEPAADERSVRAGAVALLRAEGLDEPADLLERAELSSAPVPASDSVSLRRWVVALCPADAALALADSRKGAASNQEAIRRAVAAAATRAAEAVAGVELAVL